MKPEKVLSAECRVLSQNRLSFSALSTQHSALAL
jgi:hypothetical protein